MGSHWGLQACTADGHVTIDKKNVVGTLTMMTMTMWQWDWVVRKVIWEERCGLSLGFSGLYC